MSASVSENVFCHPKHQISKLWLAGEENDGCDGDGKLCKRQVNVTNSKIDISSLEKKQSQCRCQMRPATKPANTVNGLCSQKPLDLSVSKSLGQIRVNSSGGSVKKSLDPKQQVDKMRAVDAKIKAIDCYEERMFHFPYINQIAPRLPNLPCTTPAKKNVSEYHDEINKVGSIIIRHQLHNHSKCGKHGRHCEHEIPELVYKLKIN